MVSDRQQQICAEAMFVVRIATSDPSKASTRAQYLEAHKLYLRNTKLKIIFSGPLHDAGGRPIGGMVLADVEHIDEVLRFNEADPFVVNDVYSTIEILEWNVTIANLQVYCIIP